MSTRGAPAAADCRATGGASRPSKATLPWFTDATTDPLNWRTRLGQAQRLPHGAREADQHAEPARRRVRRHGQRVAQVGRAVGSGSSLLRMAPVSTTGAAPGVGHVQPERGLLHGVGAVGDHHAVGAGFDRGRRLRRRSDPSPSGSTAELSTAIRSTTSRSYPGLQARDQVGHRAWVGRATPSAPVLVAMVPGGDHDEAAHAAIVPDRGRRRALGEVRGRNWPGDAESDRRRLGDDGRVTDESTDSVEATKTDDSAEPQPRRRLWLLVSVAVTVLVLDIVTKALAVQLLTPNQPVSIIGDTVTWTLVRNPGAAFSMAAGYTWC